MASLEIIDLIQQNLEQEGILNKIRSQLLASVVNILNNKENNYDKNEPIINFLSTEQGKVCFQIVADLLSVLKMNATLSVFLNECGVEYSDKIRSNLSQSIGVTLSNDKPIMLTILESGISNTTKSSPNSKSEEKVKEKEKQHNEKHNQNLKPVSNNRHRKGGHMEPENFMDSDLEASTSSISSITSHGSGKGLKSLAPLAPLGGSNSGGLNNITSLNKGKEISPSLTQSNFPSHSGNLKHLSPLAPLGSLPPSNLPTLPHDKLSGLINVKSPENSLKRSSPTLESLDKPKSNALNHLENSYDDDDKVPLSPYDGKKDRENDDLEYSVPESIVESASFEESSKVSFEQSQKEEKKNEKLSETLESNNFIKNNTTNNTNNNNSGLNRIEVTNKISSKHFHDDSDDDNADIDNIPSLNKNTNVIQSSAQVTRSTKGWNNSPDKTFSPTQQLAVDTEFDTSHISEYAESFEESLASEGVSPIRPMNNNNNNNNNEKKLQKDLNENVQPVKTIDDLLSDDDDDDDDENNEDGEKEKDKNRISPSSQSHGHISDHDDFDNDDFGEVRSSRADSVDTISRQRITNNNQKTREAFGNQNKPNFNKKTDLLSPNESDDDNDDIYGQVENSPQYDDPSHSAILDESGGEQDHNELSFSRRSNQEDENDIDFLAITRGSNIKKTLNTDSSTNLPSNTIKNTNTNITSSSSSSNPNNRSKRSEEDDDDYGDDDFEDGDNDDNKEGDDESYIESLDEEIEEAEEEDDNEFSFGGASSGEEDMLNRKDKNNAKLSQSKGNNNSQGNRSIGGPLSKPTSTTSGGKYDHNSSDDDDLYMPNTRRTNEIDKKTTAKTDQNSDDDQDDDYFPSSNNNNKNNNNNITNSKPSGSLFNNQSNIKKSTGPKYDDNSRDEDEFEDVPETGSGGSDFSAGDGGSDGESLLHEESFERSDFDHKIRGDSNDFSMSEQEISGSHGLDGYDYTTNALPPARRLGGR